MIAFQKVQNRARRSALRLSTLVHALDRRQKRKVLILLDSFSFLLSIALAFWFRFGIGAPEGDIWRYKGLIVALLVIKILVFRLLGIYRPVLRYTGGEFLSTAFKAVLLSSSALVVLAYLLESFQLPRSVLINDALLTLLFVVSIRLSMRYLTHNLQTFAIAPHHQQPERVVIYGAGASGSELAQALENNLAYRLIAFVDDNPVLHHHVVQGLTVCAPTDLPLLKRKRGVDTVLLAMPSINGQRRNQIINNIQSLEVQVKTVPSVSEILSGDVSISKIRQIDIADLLGREQVAPNLELLQTDITRKAVLVTGAGGSIGSELCRQIAAQHPSVLILFELNEFALYSIDLELTESSPLLHKVACLGTVTDATYLKYLMKHYQIDTVYHAAAYKHVPLVEANPSQGIINNIQGTLTAARCAIDCGVNKFVLISTDKAVRPTNVMGASKRVAELILQALADLHPSTCLTMVRFGNVLGSSGSVVPRFRQQIAEGKPITLTHPEITRYFMSIPEAASLVIQAGAMSRGGEVFLLNMGEPVKIQALAMQMIRLSGLEPGKDIEIKITGLRPGEKIYEELLIDCDNAQPTQHAKIFCAHEVKVTWDVLEPELATLFFHARQNDHQGCLRELRKIVPEYQRSPQFELAPMKA
jgi:FlaA1/EpsC-like NDP-sugar epimerase